ncbi:MAG TPA: hypothetical protein VF548_07640 [Allosphingosinicella sp.]
MLLPRKAIVSAILVSLTVPGFADGASGVARTESTFGYVEVSAADVETAIDEGRAAQAAARNALALPDVRFGITDRGGTGGQWVNLAADGKPVYSWMFRRGPGDRKPVPSSNTLSHEIGHDLFIRYLVPSSRDDQYGGDAPDWLDEMAAIAFEGAELTASRRRQAARYAREATLLPLGQFLTMTHPEWASRPPPAPSREPAPSGETFEIRLAISEDSPRFYATGRAFYDFLVDRTKSAAIVAELAIAFRKGERLDRWILSRTGHKGPSAGLGALNAEFLAWIASDERYDVVGAKGGGVATSLNAAGAERAAGRNQ